MTNQEIIDRVAERISNQHEVAVIDLGGQASDPVVIWTESGWSSTPFQSAGTTIRNVANWLYSQGGVGDLVEIHGDGSTTWYGVGVGGDAADGVAESEIGETLEISEIDHQDVDEMDGEKLAEYLGIDLSEYTCQTRHDASHEAKWIEAHEQREWSLPAYAIIVGDRVLMWTNSDEAGVADVTIEDAEDDLNQQVKEYAESIATGLGELVEAD